MRVMVIVGSRDHEGYTARAVKSIMSIFSDDDSTIIYLPKSKILNCIQCGKDGWGECRSKGTCLLEDDFNMILNKMQDIGLFIFATPVYFSDLSESMKAFLDRLRRVSFHNRNEDIEGRIALGICVAGGGGGGSFKCGAKLEEVLNICGFNVYDIISVRRQNFEMKNKILIETGSFIKKNEKTIIKQ